MLIARNHSSDEAMVGSWVSSMEAVWGSLAAVEARKQHSTDSNTGSSSANGSVSRAAEGTAGGVAACRKAARSAVEDATAAGDGRTAAVGAEGSDAQQEQVRKERFFFLLFASGCVCWLVEARKQHSTGSNSGSGSSDNYNGSSTADGVAACRQDAGSAVDGAAGAVSGAAGDCRIADGWGTGQ
jgi:hypothetical protein